MTISTFSITLLFYMLSFLIKQDLWLTQPLFFLNYMRFSSVVICILQLKISEYVFSNVCDKASIAFFLFFFFKFSVGCWMWNQPIPETVSTLNMNYYSAGARIWFFNTDHLNKFVKELILTCFEFETDTKINKKNPSLPLASVISLIFLGCFWSVTLSLCGFELKKKWHNPN